MENLPTISLQRLFEDLDDPRVVGRSTYSLVEVVIIAICAVLCGAESWTEIEAFGESKRAWLEQFLALKQGIAAHDTFRRIFSILPTESLEVRFREWVARNFRVEQDQVVAIDGKTVRGAGLRALHMVSAWAHRTGVVLGQRKGDEKSNEIRVIPPFETCLFRPLQALTPSQLPDTIVAKKLWGQSTSCPS